MLRRFFPTATDVATFALCFTFGRQVGTHVRLHTVEGPSMLPTLVPGEVFVALPARFLAPDAYLGRIVTFASSGTVMCKRVKGVFYGGSGRTGDAAGVERAGFLVGGAGVDGAVTANGAVVSVWAQGDNAAQSHDSRDFGPVPAGAVRDVAVAVVWPLGAARMLPRGA